MRDKRPASVFLFDRIPVSVVLECFERLSACLNNDFRFVHVYHDIATGSRFISSPHCVVLQ